MNFKDCVAEEADKWQQNSLKVRELQPFEDYYKAVKAYADGAEFGYKQAIEFLRNHRAALHHGEGWAALLEDRLK